MMRLALICGVLAGCVTTSQVGPYVKHVARNGDWLMVHKCMIVLEGDNLRETSCTVEQVPLRTIPMQPGMPGQPGMPSQPAMPGQPAPPAPPTVPAPAPRR